MLAAPSSFAQLVSGVLEFDTKEWDFGKIDEANGSVAHTFMFLNKSDKPVRIEQITVSCTCVTTRFTTGHVAPGQTGEINVTFSPSGSVGETFRSLEVIADGGKCYGLLTLKADVNPMDREIKERYHSTMADFLYANRTAVPFGYVYEGKLSSKTVYIANASDKKMDLRVESRAGSRLKVECPKTIAPGEETYIMLTYDIPKATYRTYSDTVTLFVNGKKALRDIVTTAISMREVPQNPNGPGMYTTPSVGILKGNAAKGYSATIELGNNGKGELIIHSVEVPEGVSVNLNKGDRIKAGGKVKVTAVSKTQKPFQVNVFTNDPKRPYRELKFESQK